MALFPNCWYMDGIFDSCAAGLEKVGTPPSAMPDLLEQGIAAFEEQGPGLGDCEGIPYRKAPGCIFLNPSQIRWDERGVVNCPACGISRTEAPMEAGLEKEKGEILKRWAESKTGAERGREAAWALLRSRSDSLELSTNALGDASRLFNSMREARLHLGGRGLKPLVYASLYLAARNDFRNYSMRRIVGDDKEYLKRANRTVTESYRKKLVQRVSPTTASYLKSHFSRKGYARDIEKRALELSELDLGLRPVIHASGALYIANRENNVRITQRQIGELFNLSRKHVGIGYRAIKERTEPGQDLLRNPSPVGSLTGSQIRLLREIRS